MPSGKLITGRHLICVVLTILILALLQGAAQSLPSQASFERLTNYPYRSLSDLDTVNARVRSLMGRPLYDNEDGMEALARLDAFTSPSSQPAETVWVEVFATSENPAILRLKQDVRLPIPRGGAIVRLYKDGSTMPGSIKSLFSKETAGVTLWSRYIAIDGKERSQAEIDNIVSHELVHAYVISILGLEARKVPIWFHEGTALWISGGKRIYASPPSFSGKRISYSTKEYNSFLTVFEYLEATHGKQAVYSFIRESVKGRSVAGPLRKLEGNTSYAQLQERALEWRKARQLRDTLFIGLPLFCAAIFFWIRGMARRPAEKQALDMVRTAANYAQRGLLTDAADLLKLAEQTAPWSSLVRKFARRIRFEFGL